MMYWQTRILTFRKLRAKVDPFLFVLETLLGSILGNTRPVIPSELLLPFLKYSNVLQYRRLWLYLSKHKE